MMPGLTLLALMLAAPAGDAVVARVDGVPIARGALVRRLDAMRGPGRAARPEAALDALVAEALLANEGRKAGLASAPEVVAQVEAATRRAAADLLMVRLGEGVKPEEGALRTLFHSTNDFASFESLVFETRDAAAAARKRIDAGGTLAAEAKGAVVSQLQPDPKAAPPVMRGQIEPALASALFAAAPGQHVGPLELKVGWGVARLIRKEIGTEETYRARRESLVAYGKEQGAAAARKHLVAQLKARANPTVDEAFLKSLQGTQATPAQLEQAIAVVNGRPIRYRDVHGTLRALGAAGGHMGGPAVKIQLAWREVESRLLEDAAIEQKLGAAPEVVSRRPELERAAIASAAAAAIEARAPAPSEEEIVAFHRQNAARYDRPFEQVLPAVAADAAAAKRRRALDAHVDALRKKASVEIDRKVLESASRS